MEGIDLKFIAEIQPTLDRLQGKKAELAGARPLPNSAINKINETLALEWTYNSNSIEGNTLTLRETQMVIQDGMTVGGKSLREHFETHNHHKAIDLLESMVERDTRLDVRDVLSVHEVVLRSIEDDFAGRLRTGGVRISGANFILPNARKVSSLIDELVDFVNNNPQDLDAIILATVFHHKFVWIHPFFDGNGRTVRLLMNLILMKAGYPPAIILKNDRKKYYTALNAANKGDYSKLALMMCQALERSLNIYLEILPRDASYDYVPISTIVSEPMVPYGQEYLSLLARTGKIDAHKEGRNWVTTRRAIQDYIDRH